MSTGTPTPAVSDEEADVLDGIVAIVGRAAGGLPAAAIEQIVLEVAPVARTRRLQIALEKRPGLMTGRYPDVPVTAQKLCHALVAAGATGVVLPACQTCGRHLILPHKAPGGGRHCSRCERNRRATTCTRCGHVRPVQRSIDGQTLCRQCWRADPRSFGICSRCGRNATLIVRRPEFICADCYRPPVKRCGLCGADGRVGTHLDGIRVCKRCYYAMRRPHPCPGCGQKRFLTRLEAGRLICAQCAGAPENFACPGCGSATISREKGLCDRCRQPAAVHRLLSGADGRVPDALQPLEDYLLAHPRGSDSLEDWARHSDAGRVLADLVESRLDLNADAIIDALASPHSAAFLLALLTDAGLLGDLDVAQARFDHWLTAWLAAIPDPSDRLILRRYQAWGTNPLTRSPVSQPTSTQGHMNRQRSHLRQSAALLAHIRSTGHTLATFPQRDLDRWLSGSAIQTDALAPFTRWLRDNRLSHLNVPHRHRDDAATYLDPDLRWTTARRLLNDGTIPAPDRVAGLLTLLYGMQATRIVALERSAVTVCDHQVHLSIGSDPIQVPAPLGQALLTLLEASAAKSGRWLFPGRHPGAPLTAGALGQRLKRHGIPAAQARTTTLLELAQHMHPRVLSDLLGLSTATAAKWWRLAGGDWTGYPALRE